MRKREYDPRPNHGLVSSLNADWKQEQELNKTLNQTAPDDMMLERLASRSRVGSSAHARTSTPAVATTRGEAQDSLTSQHKQQSVTFSKKNMRLQNLNEAVKQIAHEPNMTPAKRRSSGKKVKNAFKNMFHHTNSKDGSKASKKKPPGVLPKLGENAGDTAKGSQRGRARFASDIDGGNAAGEEKKFLEDNDSHHDLVQKQRLRSKSEGLIGRMRRRSTAQRQRQHRQGGRGSLSPRRTSRVLKKSRLGSSRGGAGDYAKSSTSSLDNDTALLGNKGSGGAITSTHVSSIVAEAQAAREMLLKAQQHGIARESSAYIKDRSERTISTHAGSDMSDHRKEEYTSSHRRGDLTAGKVIREASIRRGRSLLPPRGDSHRQRSRMTKPTGDFATQNASISSQLSLLDTIKSDTADQDPLHVSDSQFDYSKSSKSLLSGGGSGGGGGVKPKKSRSRMDESSDSTRQHRTHRPVPTKLSRTGKDESSGSTRQRRTHGEMPPKVSSDSTRQRRTHGEEPTKCYRTSTDESSGSTRQRITLGEVPTKESRARKNKGMSASDRTHGVRTRSAVKGQQRDSRSTHRRSLEKDASQSKSLREKKITGLTASDPSQTTWASEKQVVDRLDEGIERMKSLKFKGMSASERTSKVRTSSPVEGHESSTGSKHKRTGAKGELGGNQQKSVKQARAHEKHASSRRGKAKKELHTSEHSTGGSAHARSRPGSSPGPSTKRKKKAKNEDDGAEEGVKKSHSVPRENEANKMPFETTTEIEKRKRSTSLGPRMTHSSSNRSRRSRGTTLEAQDIFNKSQMEQALKQHDRHQQKANERDKQRKAHSYHQRTVGLEEDELGSQSWHDSSDIMRQRPSSVPLVPKASTMNSKGKEQVGKDFEALDLDRIDLTSLDPAQTKFLLAKKVKVARDAKPKTDINELPHRTSKSNHARSTTLSMTGEEKSARKKDGAKQKTDLDFFSEHGRLVVHKEHDLEDVKDFFHTAWRELGGTEHDLDNI